MLFPDVYSYLFLLALCVSAVKNASGRTEVRNAMAAIEAYKNITDAIDAAEEAANEAKDAAQNALNVSFLPTQQLTPPADDVSDRIRLSLCFQECQQTETHPKSKGPEEDGR